MEQERDYWVEVEVYGTDYTVGANVLEEGDYSKWVINGDPTFGDWVIYRSDTDEVISSDTHSVFYSVTKEATKHLKNVYWNEKT
jgi:hypothetical protein